MAANLSDNDDIIAEINVTPLVDVVLVLLVIFMVTAPVIYQSAIKVSLPSAQSGEKSSQKSPLEFSLSQEGQIAMGKEVYTWETLSNRLKEISQADLKETAVINADTNATHGNVVRLMDTLRQAGLTRFALNVDAVSKK